MNNSSLLFSHPTLLFSLRPYHSCLNHSSNFLLFLTCSPDFSFTQLPQRSILNSNLIMSLFFKNFSGFLLPIITRFLHATEASSLSLWTLCL